MTDNYKGILGGVIIVLLFMFLLIMFTLSGGADNNQDISKEYTYLALNVTGINDTLQGAKDQAEIWKDTFSQGKFTVLGTGIILVSTIVSVIKASWVIITAPFTLFTHMLNTVIFQGNESLFIITYIILFVFIVSIIFAFWRLIKQGS